MLRARSAIGLIQKRCISNNTRTAGLVVIGDEVLRGDVRDSNAYFLVKNLRKYQVSVKRINFVGDDPVEIGDIVKDFSRRFDFVFTFGGVGPTHDDVTYQAIARAFGERVALRDEILNMFQSYFGKFNENSPLTKFAQIPEGATVVVERVSHSSKLFEVGFVRLENVIILPGVPLVVEKLFPVVVKHLQFEEMPEISKELFLTLDEVSITRHLNDAVEKFTDVTFGSYPELYGNYYKTRLRIEASSRSLLNDVESYLIETLPKGAVLDGFVHRPLEAAEKRVEVLAAKYDFVREAYDVVRETLQRYKPEEICVGFSGGKDCTVVAFLYYAALREHKKRSHIGDVPQNWFCVTSGSGRPEVDSFVEECVTLYGARVSCCRPPYKEALQRAIDSGLKVFLLGNRMVDPKAETLQHFKETDDDWPRAMRVFPILNWSYDQVWTFIRELYIPYCTLYDQGFSSLGDRSTPNPKLLFVDEKGITRFKPAYMLQDGSTERIGRT